ncbi:HEAT repeat domain-containing protein [Nocardiopsis ganjiahuensis]|uniref:HEAT repeat domain-containing protein n=1 Tax=Nocardiopsis ganjiahuensis TaxID=239984 RepID=UPI000344CF6D|nr:HEAT repeat domain-containing protein [Nocardiopsis ganjiahuensis]
MPQNTPEPETGAARRLLAEIAPLSGPERMRHLARYARTHRDSPLLAETAAGLDALGRSAFGAHLALAARDTGLVTGYLTGPDQDLRRSVLRRSHVLPLPDRALEELLDDAPHRLRRALYAFLCRGRREALADRLLPVVLERHGEAEASMLLPACSTPVVDEHLDGLAHRIRAWSRLVRRHPGPVLVRLERELDSSPSRALIWDEPWRAAAEGVSKHAPELLLPFLRGRSEPESPYPPYAEARRLLHLRGDELHYPGRYPALTHGRRDIRGLLKAMDDAAPRALAVLRAMRYADRTPLIDRFVAEGGGEKAALLPYLGLLPADRAESEARRVLAYLERFRAANPDHADHRDLEAGAHLPFAEAEPRLTRAAGDPDPERREHALYWLVTAAGRDGADTLARVLGSTLTRSAADRCHVRVSLPLALGNLSPRLLVPGTVPDLHRLLDDNIAAPDLDAATAAVLRHLALHLLHHPEAQEREDLADWALTALTRLVERFGGQVLERYWVSVYTQWHRRPALEQNRTLAAALDRDRARALYVRLAPFLDRGRARGSHQSTVSLAGALGRHLYAVPDLLDRALREVVLADPATSNAHEAARLYLRGSRPDERAEELFRAAPATALITPVWERLARRRPAVVPEVLAAVAPLGAAGGRLPRRFVPFHRGLTGTWLAAEHDSAAGYLWDAAADRANGNPVRAEALRGMSVLSGGLDLLLPWLHEDDAWLRETALVQLSDTDHPERALGVLLEHAAEGTSSRAVVAVLGSCARRVAPSVLLTALGGVLTARGKVTVHRAAARILGQVRPPGAVELLLDLLDRDDQHRDLRAAVLEALMAACDHPAVLRALEERRTSFAAPAARAALLAHPPLDVRPDLRARVARFMLSLPESGDPAVDGNLDVCRRIADWARWDGELAEGLVADLRDLTLSDDRVLHTFEGLLREQRYRDRLPEVVAELADLCPAAGQDVPLRRPEEDRAPSLPRRAVRLARMLVHQLRFRDDVEEPVPGLDRAVERLAAHPGLREEALDLRRADLPVLTRNRDRALCADRFGARVSAWAALAARYPEERAAAPGTVVSTVVQGRVSFGAGPLHLSVLLRHLTDLALRDATPVGRLVGLVAVGLAEQEGERRGWTGPWAGLVADLGQSPHEEVRIAAWRAASL